MAVATGTISGIASGLGYSLPRYCYPAAVHRHEKEIADWSAKPARATDWEQIPQGVAVVGVEQSERCNPR
jgi:hypothetical protein